jgi:hypothetical protein
LKVSISIPTQIARFQAMTVGQLRVEWERLYGEPTRSRNRDYLWKRLAWRVQEIQFGGLSAAAKERIIELAPATFSRSQLPAGYHPVAGMPPTPPGPTRVRRDRRLPAPGSTLVRRYKGDDLRVLVLDDGFEWNGRRFDSLSEVAFAVTGSKWNGWLFFGLTDRKRAR